MPQIKQKDRAGFLTFLESKGMHATSDTAAAASLKPTQAEYSPVMAQKFAETGPIGGSRDVLVSSDGYVLDGHHQWMAHRQLGTDIPVLRINAPIRELLAAANEFPAVQRSEGAAASSRNTTPAPTTALAATSDPPAPAAATRRVLTMRRPGRMGTAYTANNEAVPFKYALVEQDDLTASNDVSGAINPDYPKELQPRDRTTPESRTQVQAIAGKLQPERLGESGDIVNGAPLVGPDGVVESGNGRVMAIAAAPTERKAAYRQWLSENAKTFGLGKAAADTMKNPILVRVRQCDMSMDERARLGREGNRGTQQAMNSTEVARADAQLLTDDMMGLFVPSEDGDVTAASNRHFMKAFAQAIGGMEAAGLSQGSEWTKQMVDRVNAAVFSRAYGDDRLLRAFASEADPDMKNVLAALGAGAREFALARSDGAIEAGLDAGALFAEAVGLIRAAKTADMSLSAYMDQGSLFGEVPPPIVVDVARFMSDNARAHRKLGNVLLELGRDIRAELAGRQTVDIFGKDHRSLQELTSHVVQNANERNRPSQQSGLFGAVREPGGKDGRGNEPSEAGSGRAGLEAVPATGRDTGIDGRGETRAAGAGNTRPEQTVDLRNDGASYGKSLSVLDQTERGARGVQSPVASGQRRATSLPVRGQLDLFLAPSVNRDAVAQASTRQRYTNEVKLVTTGEFRSGIGNIENWQDAAHVIAPLRKSPQEQIVALVLGANNEPLAVIRHSIGEVASASVEVWSLLGAISSVPGAKAVYFAHNHPSGRVDQSGADRSVTMRLNRVLAGSGIDSRGMIVVAPGSRTASFQRDGELSAQSAARTASRTGANAQAVPQQERRISRATRSENDSIGDPNGMAVAVKKANKATPSGVLLLDNQHAVVGILPVSMAEMSKLRTGNTATGTARILSELQRGNAAAAVVFGPAAPMTSPEGQSLDATSNLSTLIEQSDVRLLDTFETSPNSDPVSLFSTGKSLTNDAFFSGRTDATEQQRASLYAPLDNRHDQRSETPSGVPAGLPAHPTAGTDRLQSRLRPFAANASEPPRLGAIQSDSLPDALRSALAAFERFTGNTVTIVRNLNPKQSGITFNGVTLRDGTLYVDETSQHPATTVAAHEFTHQLKVDNRELYQRLEDEVRRQGRIPEWTQELRRRGEDRAQAIGVEELTADAVADALTDREFLERMAQRNPSQFRTLVDALLRFLNGFLGTVRNTGSNAYLRDVEAFRDVLADVLDQYAIGATGNTGAFDGTNPDIRFSRKQQQMPDRFDAEQRAAAEKFDAFRPGETFKHPSRSPGGFNGKGPCRSGFSLA